MKNIYVQVKRVVRLIASQVGLIWAEEEPGSLHP